MIAIALIGAFARIVETPICIGGAESKTDITNNGSELPKGNTGPPVATNGEPFPWDHIKLPDNISPLEYQLFLHPNISTFTFNGTTAITVRVLHDTDFMIVHIKNLNISHVSVREAEGPPTDNTSGSSSTSGAVVRVLRTLECLAFEMLYIQVESPFRTGSLYVVSIHYSAEVSRQLVGFYRSSYLTSAKERR